MDENTFLKNFISFIKNESLIEKNDRIVLAVSGGCDSLVLMDLFNRIESEWDLDLVVAHVNHSLRGIDSDNDENFVREKSRQIGIQFFSKKVNVLDFSKKNKLSLEEAARYLRFEFLNSLLEQLNYNKIILAHHADDFAETILMNLIRGMGLRGLRGIKSSRDNIIHPLLFATQNDILLYAKDRSISFSEDKTNYSKEFVRNKIRLNTLNLLKKDFGAQIVHSICRSGKILEEIEDFLNFSTKNALKKIILNRSRDKIILDIDLFLDYFVAVKKNIIISIIEMLFPQYKVTYSEINSIYELILNGKSGGKAEFGYKGEAVKYRNEISFNKKKIFIKKINVSISSWILIPEIKMRFKAEPYKTIDRIQIVNKNSYLEFIDSEKIELPLTIRSWSDGDKFIPLGMTGEKKVQDFFIDEHIPVYKRKSIPILCDAKRIIWIIGKRINDSVKISDNTKKILKLEAKK